MRTKALFTFMIALTAIVLLGCPNPTTPPTDKVITIAAIPGVAAPKFGATPVTSIETSQYTGTVTWNGNPATFESQTSYIATIILTAKSGFTMTGVAVNYFTVAGAASNTNGVNSGVITAVFPATETVINIAAIPGITAPAAGVTPVTSIETSQYTGTVTWNGNPATFAASTIYTATINLTAKAGFTMTKVAVNYFTVAGATSSANLVNSGVITAVFPKTGLDYISTNIGTLKAVPGGTFNNGTADMTVSSFWMSQHEITGAQYAAVMGSTDPSKFASVIEHPVENVTWYDAVEFCNKLSAKEGLTPVYTVTGRKPTTGYPITSAVVTADWTAKGYRLPTEAEWQFAARGGNSSHNYTYAGSSSIESCAWYAYNSSGTTHAVGTKSANELGLNDMSGNVWEWCWDWYADAYPATAQMDYRGAASGTSRIVRGGAYFKDPTACTVAWRAVNYPYDKYFYFGFRVVRP